MSKMVKYPADTYQGIPAKHVAHWAHPIEIELIAQKEPGSSDWPVLLLQVGFDSLYALKYLKEIYLYM